MPEPHPGQTDDDIVGSLRRAAQLADDEPDQTAGSGAPGQQPTLTSLRPWTVKAAMEPLPPLAPPVETRLTETRSTAQRPATTAPQFSSRVIAELIALIVLVVVAIVFLLAKHGGR